MMVSLFISRTMTHIEVDYHQIHLYHSQSNSPTYIHTIPSVVIGSLVRQYNNDCGSDSPAERPVRVAESGGYAWSCTSQLTG